MTPIGREIMLQKLELTSLRTLVALGMLALNACAPADLVIPEESIGKSDSSNAVSIVLKVESQPTLGEFMELDQVMIIASVLSESGAEIRSGGVEWQAQNAFGIVARGPREAELQLRAGFNVVRATFRNSRGVILEAQLAIEAKASTYIAVVWGPDGSITQIPQPANVRTLYPRAINDRGEVVGTAQFEVARRAFIWSGAGGFRIIGPGPEDYSEGHDINDEGVAVGYRRIVTRIDGFLWTSLKGFLSLGTTIDPTTAVGINNSGVVAGGRDYRAVRWGAEGIAEPLLLTPGGKCSGATAIGAAGHVIGWVGTYFEDGWCLNWSPVLWDPDGAVQIIHPCSHQIDCSLQVTDINGTAEVVGNNSGRPFRWSKEGGFREMLGDATGVVFALNDKGEAAGAVNYPDAIPTVWDRNNHMRSLPLPQGRHVGTVHAINNKGHAVGMVK